MPVQLVLDLFAPAIAASPDDRPGTARLRSATPVPTGYAVFDCETTGTDTGKDEIVSLAPGQAGVGVVMWLGTTSTMIPRP